MKKVILFAAFMLMVFCGFGQMDYKFNYQAVVRTGSGALVPNGSTVGMRISILEGTATGAVLYQETHSVLVNNSQGLVNLIIGGGTPTVGGILFSGKFYDLTKDKYIKVEVDPTGGTSYTDLGASKLQFVPYAAHSFTASLALEADTAHYSRNGYYAAYAHTTTSTNTSGHITHLTYTGMAATDIVLVTHFFQTVNLPRVPYSVFWTGVNWAIYLDKLSGTETMPIGTKFNVLVIKP